MALPSGSSQAGLVAILVCLLGSSVGIFIYNNSAPPCECSPFAKSTYEEKFASCKTISYELKVPLIAVHLIPFVLMPVSMWVCQKGARELQSMGMKNPEQVVLGLAYIMVSIGGEVGWHVHQRWFYQEEYDVLNFFFYTFITLGATFWALGAQTAMTESRVFDALLWLCTPLTAVTYAWAASSLHSLGKIPIYLIMSYQYLLLAWRLFKLLNDNWHVWWFPFFSIGANLFFVALLVHNVDNVVLNPIFHMLHDAAGTEMGVAIITYLIWNATSNKVASKKAK